MPETKLVRPLDAGWLWLESASNIMHGTLVTVFRRPPDAGIEFVTDLVADMRGHSRAAAPFNRRLRPHWLSRVAPQWETVESVDLDYHLHHVTLADGSRTEFDRVVSDLHSRALDPRHPLWTVHVIDGLPDGRFAVVGRMHHALVDGVAALGLVKRWLAPTADATGLPPLWDLPRPIRAVSAPRPGHRRVRRGGLAALGRALRLSLTGVSARPWSAPRTALNRPITAGRAVTMTSIDLRRLRTIARATGSTVNDVLLAACGGALRSYLAELGQAPERSLVTNMPVSVRSADRLESTGNEISWAMVKLATDVAEPLERLRAVTAATRTAKAALAELSGAAMNLYTILAVTPILAEQLLKLGGRARPLYNVPISNVPGPATTLFYNGAQLEDVHVLTVLYGGQALNIVAVSYGDRLELTFTACDAALPGSDALVGHLAAALDELEHAVATSAGAE